MEISYLYVLSLSTHNILLHYGISTKNRTFTERKRSEDWRGEIERDTSKRKYENCIERNHSTANNHKHSSRNRDKTVSFSLTDKPITIPNDTRTEPNDSNDTRTEPNEDNETTITKNRSYTRVRKGNVSQKDKGIILTSLLLLSHSLSLYLPLLPSFYLSIALSLSFFSGSSFKEREQEMRIKDVSFYFWVYRGPFRTIVHTYIM